ncbi:MAG TPA: hypothetical protein VNJ46_02655 [Gaiellaceae bacterium]|nr:hypothetical protein [Gaiellaceae bacterium]
MRLLVTFTFVFLWWSLVGRDVVAYAAGGVALALAWTAYGHFVGRSGLPDTPLRLAGDPPPTTVEWTGYRDLWLISLPILVLVACAALVLWGRALEGLRADRSALVAAAPVAAVALPLFVAAPIAGGGGTEVRLEASGPVQVEQGAWFSGELAPGTGSLTLEGEDAGGRVTPLPPHDRVELRATLTVAGTELEIAAHRPLVDDPLGRFGTWWGIGRDVWHHGESGIGSDRLPAVKFDVALFAAGSVRADGEEVAAGAPVHVMTLDEGLELHVGDQETPIPGLPDGHVRAIWADYEGGAEDDLHVVGYVVGSLVLLVLLVLARLALRRGPAGRPGT